VASSDIFSAYAQNYQSRHRVEMSLEAYLRGARGDPMMYASAPERLLAAIGEPESSIRRRIRASAGSS